MACNYGDVTNVQFSPVGFIVTNIIFHDMGLLNWQP